MKLTWTKGLSAQEKDELSKDFVSVPALRARLIGILNEKIVTTRRTVTGREMYDSPSWAYVQADAVGYERALREVISLFESNSVEKNQKKE